MNRVDDIAAELSAIFSLQKRAQHLQKATTAQHRIEALKRFRASVERHQEAVKDALVADLRRPRAGLPEIGGILAEIDFAVAHLVQWMRPVEVAPLLPIPGAKARITYEPRGVCAVFGAWNFPVLLSLQPLVAIIAAGNCAIVKPNELTPASSRVVASIVREAFAVAEVAVVEGGVEVAKAMQALPFDHVFFTGSPAVGKQVMQAAAQHLSSVTLELGGKCPVIIDGTADLKEAASKVIAGRCANAGQLCLAPDHVWIKPALRKAFVDHLKAAVQERFYVGGRLNKDAFGRIVNMRNLMRLRRYLDDAAAKGATVAFGGQSEEDDLTMHPTVLVDVPLDAEIMREEIFGPILPVLNFNDEAEIFSAINAGGKPLAMYIFSRDQDMIDRVLLNTSSGGVTINDTYLHALDPQLPFGGVNGSGMGRYHGMHGFRELSHERSIFIA